MKVHSSSTNIFAKVLKRLAPAAMGLALTACATFAPRPPAHQEIALPVASETGARLFRVGEIRTSAEFEKSSGFWDAVWKFVVGEKETQVQRPYGLFADSQGRLLVADPGLGVVHLFDRTRGSYRTVYTRPGGVQGSPIGITGDRAETIWFTDSTAGTVTRYIPRTKELQPFLANLNRPTGIAFNPANGLLYVSETSRHQIRAFEMDGTEKLRFGGRGDDAGQFNFPTDICIDPEGRVIVTDALNARIQVFTAEGVPVHMFGSPGDSPGYFAKPKGIATDERGWLYVADALFDVIQVFDPDGTLVMTFGRTGAGPGEFWMPTGVYIGGDGLIYISDSYNRRVQIFRIEIPEDES